jgi:hypothetical protein
MKIPTEQSKAFAARIWKSIVSVANKKVTTPQMLIGGSLIGGGLYLGSEIATHDTKKKFEKYNEPFPKNTRIMPFTTDLNAVASYSRGFPSVVFANPINIQHEKNSLKVDYPTIDMDKADVGIIKHELRHAEIDKVLLKKGYSRTQRETLYSKTKCLQEVDAEKTMYHFMAKNDPSFKKHFPTVASMSGYADECHKEFAENEKLGNKPESAESVVKRIQALEAKKGQPIQKP